MATGLQTWSKTAGSNATADTAVNWAEGQAPSSVNDSARAMMASAASWRDDNNGTLSTTGSSAAFTVTSNQGSTGNIDGQTVTVQFHATADAAATLAKDSNTAAKIQLIAGTNLTGGEIPAGAQRRLRYSSSSTAWIIEGERSLIASDVSAGFVTGTMIADTTIASTKLIDSTIATTKIADAAITYAKIQNVTASRILANLSTSAAAPSEYSLSSDFIVSGSSVKTYGPKAWVTFTLSGTTVTIQKSYNVASVVRNSTGNFTITFTNAMTDQYYVPVAIAQKSSGSNDAIVCAIHVGTTPSTTSFVLGCADNVPAAVEPSIVSIAVFGN